jgi:hypothetical protein
VDGAAYGVALGDFNKDRKLDVAHSNRTRGMAGVLLGNGDGTFQADREMAVGKQPVGVAVADFNRDGNPDLAVSNEFSDTVSVLLGNGDGTFR